MSKDQAQQERERQSKQSKSVSTSEAETKRSSELNDEELGRVSGGVSPGPCKS